MNETFTRDEAVEFQNLLKENLFGLFEGASDVFEIEACGAFRRGEAELKELDFLITRNDGGPTRYLLMKLVEHLEEKGIIVQ
jgi:glutathione synthase/RimK-type ligase-like ATP-grasp enzyme